MSVQEKPRRWTATCSDDDTLPVGPVECGLRAVARLGPSYRPAEGFNRFGICKELAIERVEILARQFNRIEFLNKGAPRPKQIVQNLDELERLAGELARSIESLDDMTRHRLSTAGT